MGQKKSRIVAYDEDSYYCGQVINNKDQQHAEGRGNWGWGDSIYHGEFKSNRMNGKGVCIYEDGSYYDGQFKDNVKHGEGTMFYKDGCKYIGSFENDLCHGNGKFIYESGDYYIGEFSIDNITGKGKMFDADNRLLYDGEWLYGTFHGYGKYYNHNNVIVYDGLWKEGVAHGRGKYYDDFGKLLFDGYFEEGEQSVEFIQKEKINKNKASFDKKFTKKPKLDRIETFNPYNNIPTTPPLDNLPNMVVSPKNVTPLSPKIRLNKLSSPTRNNVMAESFKIEPRKEHVAIRKLKNNEQKYSIFNPMNNTSNIYPKINNNYFKPTITKKLEPIEKNNNVVINNNPMNNISSNTLSKRRNTNLVIDIPKHNIKEKDINLKHDNKKLKPIPQGNTNRIINFFNKKDSPKFKNNTVVNPLRDNISKQSKLNPLMVQTKLQELPKITSVLPPKLPSPKNSNMFKRNKAIKKEFAQVSAN